MKEKTTKQIVEIKGEDMLKTLIKLYERQENIKITCKIRKIGNGVD